MGRREITTRDHRHDEATADAAAENLVASWRKRIARQQALIEDLAAKGKDVGAERALLSQLLDCAPDALP